MLAQSIRRVLRTPGVRRLTRRPAEGRLHLVRTEAELSRSAFSLAHAGGADPLRVHGLLHTLWTLDDTTAYVQVVGAAHRARVVVTRVPGHRVIVASGEFRAELQTEETAPNGAYLTERQYRRLGHYAEPPADRVIIVAAIRAGIGGEHLVDVPDYVSHATVVMNHRVLADATVIPPAGLRCELRT
jgi:hypothetical protein